MENYKVEGFCFDGKNQIVPKSVITDDPMKLTGKMGILKVSKLDNGDVLYDKEEIVDVSFVNWWNKNIVRLFS
ncbi:MAG: hypothetical protein O2832_00660 [Proteobacteria bacterium]|nr:hypothetical protein [Pseudomonadota bacterium]